MDGDRLERTVREVEDSPRGRSIMADIAELRKDASEATVPRTTAGGGRGHAPGSPIRLVASIPNEVMGAIQLLYPQEMHTPDFWRWFLRKYPQFRVQE